ncbi:hypothetical protein [Paraburkholderia sp. BL9I2N2]|uniref:hypothetical protein n=1 Tax=Paraburkholderia sp. BL9I2N2 TaxID=1938809 RepID=UPI0010517198|nr:hypothetical protein [Paraburkholderia sp. BL9I2N2]TCK97132.1 hypothetical protein B0G74_3834 [Paraburkholderia sp. BL9I2N2]
MATAANVLMTFVTDGKKEVAVTVTDDERWTITGDPKSILPVGDNTWVRTPDSGTELKVGTETVVILVALKLHDAAAGDSEIAYLFPSTANEVGRYQVTDVI